MNPLHLRVQLLDCDTEEQQRDRPHIPNKQIVRQHRPQPEQSLLATFAPGALAATLTAVTRTDGRLIRPSSTRILQLNDTGQWATVNATASPASASTFSCAISTKRSTSAADHSSARKPSSATHCRHNALHCSHHRRISTITARHLSNTNACKCASCSNSVRSRL
jgi:hypothetical protein